MALATGAVAIDNGTVLVLIALIAVPFAAFSFSRAGEAYRSIGKGALAMEHELPVPRYVKHPDQAVDPAVQAAEVRQMLEAKAERLRRRGEASIDVGTETVRLLEGAAKPTGQEAELRAEVRQLVLTRNERRMRKGLTPLDVEAETDRQLADFIGSD
jgi:hypothetical protein